MREDVILIKEIQMGNEQAMEELIHRYYDEIYRYVYRLLGSIEEAKDITQEVFIAMLKAIPTYKEQGKFKAWLYRIAHNRCMNTFRYTKHLSNAELDTKILHTTIDDSEQLADRAFVAELLSTLPVKQRSAIILKYYHDLTTIEIAKISGTSVPTIKSRLFQGLRKLKKRMKEDNNYEGFYEKCGTAAQKNN